MTELGPRVPIKLGPHQAAYDAAKADVALADPQLTNAEITRDRAD